MTLEHNNSLLFIKTHGGEHVILSDDEKSGGRITGGGGGGGVKGRWRKSGMERSLL